MSVKSPYENGCRPYVWSAVVIAEDSRPVPEIGDRRTFIPAAFEGEHQQGLRAIRPEAEAEVTGTVVYVNEAHRWCRVRYDLPGGVPAFECFKF